MITTIAVNRISYDVLSKCFGRVIMKRRFRDVNLRDEEKMDTERKRGSLKINDRTKIIQ